MKNLKKVLSFVLVLVLVLSVMPKNVAIAAQDPTVTEAQTSSSYEPWAHGYRFVDILNWTPETDDYSEELVAKVPLQERIGTFAATQANTDLSDESRLYVISSSNYRNTDTSNGPWNAGMAYDEFGYNLFKFWQYADMTGSGGRPTSEIDEETKAYIGSFEYGTIAIPQASATNAAHMNGVLSLAEYFTPRVPQITEEWLYQAEDGSFPYAQKLIDIMNYYGFDGYFINQEEDIPSAYVPMFRDMLKWMTEQGAYIQWYDSIGDGGSIAYQNRFNDYNDGWIWNEEDGRVSDSIFLNYWYRTDYLKNSKAHAEALGLDPYEVVYMGVEGGQWKFGTDIESKYNAVDENGKPYTSFAVWGSDWYQDQYDKADNNRYKTEYQWDVEERERMYFTSASENAGEYSVGEITRDDVGAGTINFQGFSKYVVEKSVISGSVFDSNFSTGHGMQYFRNGEVSRDMEWSNLNLQSILPTWQWWMQTEGESLTLEMDWDYGPEFTRHQGAFPYTQVGAYDGGNSIAVYGSLADTHRINLYKTELDVTSGTQIALTYHKTSASDASQIGIAVTFQADEGTETVVLPIEGSGAQTGWTTGTVDLSDYAGKVIAAIGVELSTAEAIDDYQINLGYLQVTDGSDHTPAAPTGVKLEKIFDTTGELQLCWNIADYSQVINYHIYAVYADGSRRFVGGAYAENYYIQNLEDRENITALEIRAVGIDGSESASTTVSLTNSGISNVKALSTGNQLVVTWDGGEAEVELAYWYSQKEAPAAKTGNGTVTFDIDVEDGEDYILTLTNASGFVNYFGDLADTVCAPYDGEPRMYETGIYDFTTPAQGDWQTLTMVVNGSERTYSRFGTGVMERIDVGSTGVSTVTITLEDIYGNVSTAKTFIFVEGLLADLDQPLTEAMFPDDALREAIEDVAGSTLRDVMDFTGAMDLSGRGISDLTGLSILTGVTELDLSGNDITALTAAMIPSTLTKLTLGDCDGLTSINLNNVTKLELVLGDLPALTDLSAVGFGAFDLNLTGCPELRNLYLNGSQLTTLDITANTKLRNFCIDHSQIGTLKAADAAAYTDAYYWVWTGAKLDLTDKTEAGKLASGMKAYFDSADLAEEIATEETVLAALGNWYSYTGNTRIADLGGAGVVTKIEYYNIYASIYGDAYSLRNATISISDDGENFTKVMDHTSDGYQNDNTIALPEGTKAHYVKIESNDGFYIRNVNVKGYAIAPTGFYYGGQQPAMEKDDMETLVVEDDGTTHQLKDILTAWYKSAHTIASGTHGEELMDADWIDMDYLTVQAVMPTGVKVVITDGEGNVYQYPTDGPVLGNIETEKLNVSAETVYTANEYDGEEGYRMFDGSTTSKWCGSESGNWLVFQLDEARVLGQWYTLHAGAEGAGMITAAFRLQVLNPDVMAEEEYLALDESGKRAVAGNADNWIDLSVVTGNTENEVTTEVDYDGLKNAQVYRFVVDEPAQPDGNSWGALRVYEMELYAYEGELGADINGLFQADNAGTYGVSFQKAGSELAATTVTVDHAYGEWTQTNTPASCEEPATYERTCENCGHLDTKTVENEHQWDAGVVTEPSCTEGGYTTYTCTVCGQTHIGQETEALGHDYDSVVVKPTKTEKGYTEHTCKRCGDTYRDNFTNPTGPVDPESPATGDTFSELWIPAMIIALMGAVAVLVVGKKRLF